MKIAVSGSIATDHLMHFPGRFNEQLVPEQLHQVSLSFLVDELVVRRGGVAANMAFGMAQLGLRPVLVGAVGADFADYRSFLERHGVDCESVYQSEVAHTARFVCTTDEDLCQIASFYAGAMAEARNIELGPVADRLDGLDLVLIGADDPEGMLRHSDECRQRGLRFAADPSQQITRMSGADALRLIDGAAYLLTNEYEFGLLRQKTGLADAEILDRVGVCVTTLGAEGARLRGRDLETFTVPAVADVRVADPTGGGDAFRAGFFAALSWDLPLRTATEVGNMLAAHVLETDGPQEYQIAPADFAGRLAKAYGAECADSVRPHLPA